MRFRVAGSQPPGGSHALRRPRPSSWQDCAPEQQPFSPLGAHRVHAPLRPRRLVGGLVNKDQVANGRTVHEGCTSLRASTRVERQARRLYNAVSGSRLTLLLWSRDFQSSSGCGRQLLFSPESFWHSQQVETSRHPLETLLGFARGFRYIFIWVFKPCLPFGE